MPNCYFVNDYKHAHMVRAAPSPALCVPPSCQGGRRATGHWLGVACQAEELSSESSGRRLCVLQYAMSLL